MPIISVTDNENNRSKRNAKKSKKKTNIERQEQRGELSYIDKVRPKWFCSVFKVFSN